MTTNTNMPTGSSDVVYQRIQDIIESDYYGIQVSCLEALYNEKYNISLDYNSLGVENIEDLIFKMYDEDMVVLYRDGETDERYAMSSIDKGYSKIQDVPMESSETQVVPTKSSETQDVPMESSEIQDMPTEYSEIQDMPMESSDVVYQEIQCIVTGYVDGISMSSIEKMYHQKFKRLPDYGSLGVGNMKELLGKMEKKDRVLLYVERESKETYVMCALFARSFRKLLKFTVEKLLENHDGEILLSDFKGMFEDEFKLKFKYHHYGLTGPDHLCEVLNLGLEEADSSGKMVIKARKICNLRKRKRNG